MKTVTEYQVLDHGVENSQSFQGCGVAYTRFEEIATGCGSSAKEAMEDALENLAQMEWETDSIENDLSEKTSVPEDSEDCYHYVSVRVTSDAFASFNRFEIKMPFGAAKDCSHQGQCDEDVRHWAGKIERPSDCTVENLAAELKEYGAWDAEELADDEANWSRIVWLAAGNITEGFKAPVKA